VIMNWDRIHSIILAVTFAFIFTIVGIEIHAQAPHGTASEEVPRGVIDGVNTTFTLNFQPAPWGSIHVYRNGVRQMRHTDYELGGPNHTQIIFTPIPIVPPGTGILGVPQPGDILLADYTY
jgi:hypothetical protein